MHIFTYFSKNNPLQHYFYHFLIANIALFITYLTFGSITIWEVILFLFMTFFPLIDELTSAAIHYIDDIECRNDINIFLSGEVKETLHRLHTRRNKLYSLIFHNIPFYFALCSFLYILIIFDFPILFYAVAGILTHLTLDIINDQYEFKSVTKWLWPISPKHHEDHVIQVEREN